MTLRNFSSTAAQTTLSSGVDASSTTLAVSATTGFPAVPFILAVDAGAAAQELVLVTNVAGTNLTVTRGYDSTVAASHDTGAVVAHSHAAIDFREANTHNNATSGVHGVTGSVVGTTDTQPLTNKTIALGSNTISGTKAQFNAALADGDFATTDGTETLTNKTLVNPTITGGAWQSYSPTKAGFATSSEQAYYKQVGKTVTVSYTATVSSVSGAMTVGLPVPAARVPAPSLSLGSVLAGDTSANVNAVGVAYLATASTVGFTSTTPWAAASPFAWAAGDYLSLTITYEAA
jgi:hypothetical protein